MLETGAHFVSSLNIEIVPAGKCAPKVAIAAKYSRAQIAFHRAHHHICPRLNLGVLYP
jgi:hypothetical protein